MKRANKGVEEGRAIEMPTSTVNSSPVAQFKMYHRGFVSSSTSIDGFASCSAVGCFARALGNAGGATKLQQGGKGNQWGSQKRQISLVSHQSPVDASSPIPSHHDRAFIRRCCYFPLTFKTRRGGLNKKQG